MKTLDEYIIPFSGMKLGNHQFDYKIEDKFFEHFDYSEVKKGNINAVVSVEKSETMMIIHFLFKGKMYLNCDMCLGNLDYELDSKFRHIFKFSDNEDLKINDEMSNIKSSEFELDISPYIIEFINLSMPKKIKHSNGKCDKELIGLLDEYLLVEDDLQNTNKNVDNEEEYDDRWNALKKLKNNN